MKKNFLKILIIIWTFTLLCCGCDKKIISQKEDVIYTTVYPIEYLTNFLYGENASISSVFPDGSNPENYKLTNKQINNYSEGSIFIYNGLTDEKNLARKLINKNNNIKIIDVSYGLTLENGPEELWLSPSNFLMLAATVKDNLIEILNSYVKEPIEEKYNELQANISQMDAELRIIAASVPNPTIVVDSNIFKFLEKYGYTVISLEDEDNLTPNSLATIQKNFKNKTYKYILTRDDRDQNDVVKNLIDNCEAQNITMKVMATMKENDREANEDYYTLMQKNIENLRTVTIEK